MNESVVQKLSEMLKNEKITVVSNMSRAEIYKICKTEANVLAFLLHKRCELNNQLNCFSTNSLDHQVASFLSFSSEV